MFNVHIRGGFPICLPVITLNLIILHFNNILCIISTLSSILRLIFDPTLIYSGEGSMYTFFLMLQFYKCEIDQVS